MKQTNLSLAGITTGVFIVITSQIRYFILYPDIDKGFFFAIIGLLIMAVSWNYAGRVQLDKDIKKLEQTLTSVEEWIVDKNKENEDE